MKKPEISSKAVIFPGAQVVGEVTVKDGASIWYQAVLRGDDAPISIGKGTNIQDGCVIHADPGCPVLVGEGVTVGHGCILHGCRIENHVLVGMGTIILNGAVLEEYSMVGAGSLVTGGTVIPSGMLAFGRPAKPVRPLTPEEKEQILRDALH